MSNLTCLQLSDTGLYLNWDPTYLDYYLKTLDERKRLDDVFRAAVKDKTMRYFRLPTGDVIVVMDNGVSSFFLFWYPEAES